MFQTVGTFLPVLVQELGRSFARSEFWSQNLIFLSVYLFILLIASLPITALFRSSRSPLPQLLLLTFPLGFINLLLLLLGWQTLEYLLLQSTLAQLPFISGLYLIELLLVWFVRRFRRPSFKPLKPDPSSRPRFIFLVLLYVGLFFFITARHFDPGTSVFFVPGYELNHDSLNLVSSARLLKDNLTGQNNLAHYLGSQTLHYYPSGNTQLILFITHFLPTDPYFIYSRLIVASFLLTIFIVAYGLFQLDLLPRTHPWLIFGVILISLVLNFLTISILNTAVMAATISLPLIIFSWLIVYLWLTHRFSETAAFFLLTLTLLTGVFIYIYVIDLYLILFLVGLRLTGIRFHKRQLFLLACALLFSFAMPHNLDRSLYLLKDQFTSVSKEVHLLNGMSGNIGYYLNPFMAFSLWFSHPLYLVDGLYSLNSWIIATVCLTLFFVFAHFPRTKRSSDNFHLLFALSFPSACLFLFTVLFSHSPYQSFKVMQLAAVLWPLLLYMLFLPYIQSPQPVSKVKLRFGLLATFVWVCISALGIISGLFAMSYIGKPDVPGDLALNQIAPALCAKPDRSIQVIARDEWAKYFLLRCQNLDLYFDRQLNWDRIVNINLKNQLTYLSQPCVPNSLQFVEPLPTHSELVLVHQCFNFRSKTHTLTTELGPWRVYTRSVLSPVQRSKP